MQEPASVIDTVSLIRKTSQRSRKPPKHSKTRTTSLSSFALVNAPQEDPEKLTSQQRNFCLEYVRNKGNATKAALFAYNCTNDPSAGAVGGKLLVMEKIKREIAKISEQTRASAVTPELITSGIVGIALDEKTRNGDRLKGFELLARLKGLLIDRQEQRQTIVDKSIDLSGLSTPQLLAALQARLRLSSSGIRETEKPTEVGSGEVASLQPVDDGHLLDAPKDAALSIEAEPEHAKQSANSDYHGKTLSSPEPGGGGMPSEGPVGG